MIVEFEAIYIIYNYFFFQAEDGIRDYKVTGVQTCALPISDDVDQPPRIAARALACAAARAARPLRTAARGPLRRAARSEERRVGKECRSRRAQGHKKKKQG